MKRILLVFLTFWAIYSHGTTIQVGSGTTTTSYLPIRSCYSYSYSQQIYTQAQIANAGLITTLRFYYSSNTAQGDSTSNSVDWVIYLGHTDRSGFNDTDDWVPLDSLTEVFSGTVTYPETGNWLEISLITPFFYYHTDNLVVAVDENTTGENCTIYWRSFDSGSNTGIYYGDDFSNPDPASPPAATSTTGTLSQVQFEMTLSTLSATPASLDFGFVPYGDTSSVQNYQLSGFNLTMSPIVVTTPTGYGVSLSSNGPFTSSVNIVFNPPTLADTDVYVQFFPTTENTLYEDSITNTGGGTSLNVSVTGHSCEHLFWCSSSSLFWQQDDIINVTLCALNNSSEEDELAPGYGSIAGRYSNYWYDVSPTELPRGTQISFSVGTFCDTPDPENYKTWIFIDFNKDGDFADTGEIAYHSFHSFSGTHVETGTISIPVTATLGYTKMRVVLSDLYYFGYTPDCGTYPLGETEDYKVKIVNCVSPYYLSQYTITQSAANLDWSSCGTETSWDVLYGLTGFDPQTEGTLIPGIASHPYTLNPPLTSNTTYDWYVRANCGSGDTSAWAGPSIFTTLCDPVSTVSENFDSVTAPALPDCWRSVVSGDGAFVRTSISGDPHSSPNHILMYNGSGINGTQILVSPGLSQVINTLWLKFWARGYDSGYPLQLGTMDSPTGTFTAFGSPISLTTTYTEYRIYLDTYVGTDTYVAFSHGQGSDRRGIKLDNVIIEPTPSCPEPIGLLATTNITYYSAELNWTPYGSETTWDISYGLTGFDPQTQGTIIPGITSHPYTLDPPLTANTSYDWYVRADCGAGETSIWKGPATFATDWRFSTPYTQDFNGTYPPAGWFEAYGDSPDPTSGSSYWTSSVYFANLSANSPAVKMFIGNDNDDWLISPVIDLGAGNKQVSFKVALTQLNSPAPETMSPEDTVFVLYSTAIYPPYSFDIASPITFYSDSNSPPNTGGWLEAYPLTGLTGEVRFAFYIDGTGNTLTPIIHFDDFVVQEIPDCPQPTRLTITSLTDTSAELDWSPGGAETTWDILFGLQGFDPLTEGTLITGITSHPYTVNPSLNPETDYDWYARADCGSGEISPWSGPQPFRTTQTPAILPFSEDFESGPNDWTFVNGSQINQWYVSDVVAHDGSQAAYISDDGGVTHHYDIGNISISHLYRDIEFSDQSDEFELNFWWLGEHVYPDALYVYLLDPTIVPTCGSWLPNSARILGPFFQQSTWAQATITLPGSLSGQVKRLVFSWYNDAGSGIQPPIAIDDIEFIVIDCAEPIIQPPTFTGTTATLNWMDPAPDPGYLFDVYLGPGSDPFDGVIYESVTSPLSVEGLTPNTDYSWTVRKDCGFWTPRVDYFWMAMSAEGNLDPLLSGGTADDDDETGTWYEYIDDSTGLSWWNIWFYNDPLDTTRLKKIRMGFWVQPLVAGPPSWINYVVNWSDSSWAGIEFPMPADEGFVLRSPMNDSVITQLTWIELYFVIPDFNPEWVSVDIWGENIQILEESTEPYPAESPLAPYWLGPSSPGGVIIHECLDSTSYSTWSDIGMFRTQIPATLPFFEDFESGPDDWTVVNGSQTNQWYVGDVVAHDGSQAAYISDDGGTSHHYDTVETSTVHLYRDIEFTDYSQEFELSFWWLGGGETAFDELYVYLVDPAIVLPTSGSELSTSDIIGGPYNLQSTWTQANITLPGSLSGQVKRLVFSWHNDLNVGTQPPIAIDDIGIFRTECEAMTEFYEDFDGAITPFMPDCWSMLGQVYTSSGRPLSPPNCLYIAIQDGNKSIAQMPAVSNAGAGTHQLRFSLAANDTPGAILDVGHLNSRYDTSTFVADTSVIASTTDYAEHIVYLGTDPGSATTLAFRHTADPSNSILIDDVYWEPMPPCLPPHDLTVLGTTETTAELTWMGPDSFFDVFFDPGSDPFEGQVAYGVTPPLTLTGLTSSTEYNWWVRTDCGFNEPDIDHFWFALAEGDTVPGFNGGMPVDEPGEDGSWYLYDQGGGQNWWNIWFYNDPLDTNKFKKVHMGFWVQTYLPGSTPGEIYYVINWSDSTWTGPGFPMPAQEAFIHRSPVNGPVLVEPTEMQWIELYFVIRDFNPEWVSVDLWGENILIENAPIPPPPESPLYNWWNIDPLPGGIIVHECITDSSLSTLTEPGTFGTVCTSYSIPYREDFDGATPPVLPYCMSKTNDNGDAFEWVTSASYPRSAPNSMRISWNSSLAMDDWFFTPALSLQTGTYTVKFWYRCHDAAYPEKLEVKWGAAPDAGSMSVGPVFNNNNITNITYQEASGDLIVSSPGDYYVGWHGFSGANMWHLLVDDISITALFIWTGAHNSDWNEPANWDRTSVPTDADLVIIPSTPAGNYFPEVGAGESAECYDIYIEPGATLDVQTGGTLTVKSGNP